MVTLVTGATGLLGNNVVRQLLERGDRVRVLVRDGCDQRPLAGLDVEIARGDVRDAQQVQHAMREVRLVVHAAALVRFGWTELEQHRAVNVHGTAHVARAARAHGARMVHVSTVDALAVGSRHRPADEETPAVGKIPSAYVVSKREAEQVVLAEVADGLDAVIVNPAFMLGPWDWKPSSGQMLLEVARRFTPIAPTGGISLCDVRDVAQGLLAAAAQAPSGRRYILAGENLAMFSAWKLMARVSGGGRPYLPAGPLMRVIGGAWGDLRTWVTGREGEFNSAAVRASSQFHYYTSERAQREIGYCWRPVEETVRDAWAWFRQHGYA